MKAVSFSMIVIWLAAISLPSTRAHTQIEEACKQYNTIPTNNGTQSCVSILAALPGCDTSDLEVVALTGMEFTERKVSETVQTIKKKLKDKSLKPRYHTALRNCMHLYNDGSYSIGFGLLAFKEQNYDKVNYRWLNGAYFDVDQCEKQLNMVGLKGADFGIESEHMLEVSNSAQAYR